MTGYLAVSFGRILTLYPAMAFSSGGHLSTLLRDEACSPPIFNHSRIFSWSASVEQVTDAFRGASGRSQNRVPVNPSMGWVDVKEGSDRWEVHPTNRMGSKSQIMNYCLSPPPTEETERSWALSGVFTRMAIASFMAIMLRWGTAGAVVVIVFFTPTAVLAAAQGVICFTQWRPLLHGSSWCSPASWHITLSQSLLYPLTPLESVPTHIGG